MEYQHKAIDRVCCACPFIYFCNFIAAATATPPSIRCNCIVLYFLNSCLWWSGETNIWLVYVCWVFCLVPKSPITIHCRPAVWNWCFATFVRFKLNRSLLSNSRVNTLLFVFMEVVNFSFYNKHNTTYNTTKIIIICNNSNSSSKSVRMGFHFL